jgi:hypothetical protein
VKVKNAHKNNTSQSFNLIAKGMVNKPPKHLRSNPYLKSPHSIV